MTKVLIDVEVGTNSNRELSRLIRSHHHLVNSFRLVMTAREDSCTAHDLDSSVPGASGIGEASDSSQGDTSSHETELGAEKTAEVDAAAVLNEELLDDHLRSSAASKNAFAE